MRRMSPLFGLAVLLLVLPSRATAGVPEGVDRAVERGVGYLKAQQNADGTWPRPEIGATALAGLTLLECGVPVNDPAVQKAADAVRRASVNLTHTYSLALSVLFLDRLGDPADVPLIESMTVRLMAGQDANGGWTYQCPNVSDAEVRRLTNLLNQRAELVAGKDPPRAAAGKRTVRDLPQEIQQQLQLINQQGGGADLRRGGDDNSNTQFAILALWVARRHGLPTEPAIARINQRFRGSQNPDGGWDYRSGGVAAGRRGGGRSTATMTCAGLLGLAVAYGVNNEAAIKTDAKGKEPAQPARPQLDPTKDGAVRAGLLALSTVIGQPAGDQRGRPLPVIHQNGRMYYFLWSLERVAVAYGLPTIGNKDWYAWGAEILVANQNGDGSWEGEFGGDADTCFALLFLKRANLARDLSANLKGSFQDPGEATLKAGGVGGEDLLSNMAGRSKLDLSGDGDAPAARKPAEERPPSRPDPQPARAEDRTPRPETPPARAAEPDAGRLIEELVKAPADKQPALLEKLRDGKGAVFTQALAGAIPALGASMKTKARDALADRMERMTAGTLKDKLSDDDLEVRRAAALAVAMKEERSLVPRLIEMLQDREPAVARAALASLKSLTGQDLGPDADAWKKWAARQPNR